MSEYLEPIRTALRVFPGVAAAAAVPLMVLHYRRFGRLQSGRTLVLYSFCFYALAAVFLVILPLPERTADFCARYQGTKDPQLVPFTFVAELAEEAESAGSVLSLLGSAAFLQPFFNALLLLPLGVYLRYYFRLGFVASLGVLAATTVAFELVQLSGLLGLYPCPYRLFDVDDLILNTAGGTIGYAATPALARVLPSVEPIYPTKPTYASLARRLLAFALDGAAVATAGIVAMFVPSLSRPAPLIAMAGAAFASFVVLPIATGGRTIGTAIVRIRVVGACGGRPAWYRVFARALLLFGPPVLFLRLVVLDGVLRTTLGVGGVLLELAFALVLVGAYSVPPLVRTDGRGIHEIWSGTDHAALPPRGTGRSESAPRLAGEEGRAAS